MRDLIALIRALVTLIRPTRHGRHHRNGSPSFRVPAPARVELWPAPEPIVMDSDDPRSYSLVRGPYAHVERRRSTQRAERDRRGIDLLVQIARSSPALDDMAELRDLVRTAIAVGAVRR
ncbi:hypothetical protein [Nocardiopsis sp. B62]|uniref:hypothetical protein n=1 Tax=Nocardiopsis sp. B62 TaxID=2824874 RepID=UPI001FFD60D1|nr:hypothetical protein [Nocardiopsis sp. B62]